MSIYFPLLFFDLYFYSSSNIKTTHIEHELLRKSGVSQRISTVISGYKPSYYPKTIIDNIKNVDIYPIGTLPKTKTYHCDEGYGLTTYTSDRFGLRNLDKNWDNFYTKSNILVIGDSFIQGACVKDDLTITSVINRNTKVNTLNLGMGGNRPHEYIATLKSIVAPIIKYSMKKNSVLIVFYVNDNIPNWEGKYQFLNSITSIVKNTSNNQIHPTDKYIKGINNLIKNNYPQSQKEIISKIKKQPLPKWKSNVFYHVFSLTSVRNKVINFLDNSYISEPLEESPSERTISLLAEICSEKCNPIVAYIPNSTYWDPALSSKKYKIHLQNISKKMNIPFIDGEEVINGKNRFDYAPLGGHLSIEGYKKIGDLISEKIIQIE